MRLKSSLSGLAWFWLFSDASPRCTVQLVESGPLGLPQHVSLKAAASFQILCDWYEWSPTSDGFLWGLGGLIPFGVRGSKSDRLKVDPS